MTTKQRPAIHGPAAQSLRPRHLFAITTISAIDGTLIMLAAAGALDHTSGALTVGLTVIAGGGAWITARQIQRNASVTRPWWQPDPRLMIVAVAGAPLVLLAVWLGAYTPMASALHWVPLGGGLVLILLGLELLGTPTPRIGRAPATSIVIATSVILEVSAHWIL